MELTGTAWVDAVVAEAKPVIDQYNAEAGGELCKAALEDLGCGPFAAVYLPEELYREYDMYPYAFAVSPRLNRSVGGDEQDRWTVGFTAPGGENHITVDLEPGTDAAHLSAALMGAVLLMLAYYGQAEVK